MSVQSELVPIPTGREYVAAYLLESFEVGQSFGRWPLHITIVPWFETNDPTKTVEAIKDVCARHKPFTVTVGATEFFGPRLSVEVNKIESKSLRALHQAIVEGLQGAGAEFLHSHYMGNGFNPHITKKNFASVQPGYSFKVADIYLIEAPIANRLTRIKKVIGKGELQ